MSFPLYRYDDLVVAPSQMQQEQPFIPDEPHSSVVVDVRMIQEQSLIPEETRDCVPFDSVRRSTVEHPNTEEVCRTSGEECSPCCRLFEWLVCTNSAALKHLPCICNQYTSNSAPTTEPSRGLPPSTAPTTNRSESPTEMPTSNYSQAPSQTPTNRLSTSPSFLLSSSPTGAPILQPSFSPTGSPSEFPSASPSLPPTDSMSGFPTNQQSLVTSSSPTDGLFVTVIFEGESGSLRTTSCKLLPPNQQSILAANYTFSYQLYSSADDSLDAMLDSLNQQIHDAVVEQFFNCSIQADSLWSYESLPHFVETNADCSGPTVASEECFVVEVFEGISVYDSPEGPKSRLTDSVTMPFVQQINSFISDGMALGVFDIGGGPARVVYVDGPARLPNTASPTPSPSIVIKGSPTNFPTLGNEYVTNPANTTKDVKSGVSTASKVVLAVLGILFAAVVTTLVRRSNVLDRKKRREMADVGREYPITNVSDEDQDDYEQMPGVIARAGSLFDEDNDPYTSASPPRRSKRPPLYSQDELDAAISERRADYEATKLSSIRSKRKGLAKDTVDL